MLNYLFEYLNQIDFPGAGLFQYISFRAGMAAFLSLLITITFGKRLINMLRSYQMGESIRDLGLEGQLEKQGTPTMGGIIIISGIVIPTLLVADLSNIYIILLVISALWMGSIGFLDDYLKVKKKNKEGLRGKFKVIGQVGLGLLVGLVMVFHEDIVVRDFSGEAFKDESTLLTTIPFVANNEFQYDWLLPNFLSEYAWMLYVLVVIFIVTAVSNGANITDGLDGLAAGTSAIIGLTLAVLAYLSGNAIFSDYLNIMFIPNSGELVIFCTAFVGACIGFLWFNAYPAQVFMGDVGALALGAAVGVLAVLVRQEIVLVIMGGVFVLETVSVIMQVVSYKLTGKRIFQMAPLHHHFELKGWPEPRVIVRFWIITFILVLVGLATLKLR